MLHCELACIQVATALLCSSFSGWLGFCFDTDGALSLTSCMDRSHNRLNGGCEW